MCGICGTWGTSNQGAVSAMVRAMRHRGPDDSGVFTDEHASLGVTRLAIIDLSCAAHQPMSNSEQNIWIVFNGEIYNFREKRIELEKLGYRFTSNSDTEVVLRLYEHYGDDFLLHLRGMFALAIYDKRRKERLLLARDQLGIKPLLYAEVNRQVVFASEIKALLASSLIARELDPEALRLLLTFGSVYQPHTMLRDVKMLLPAHRLVIEDGRTRIERYWSLEKDRQPELRFQPYEEQVRVLSAALAESVRLHMVSDVPLGAFLSGGVDSSILVALMACEAGKRVKTFSVGFEAEGADIDESHDARRIAEFLGTEHHHVLVCGVDVRDRIFEIASALDQPSVDGVNAYFVSWAARQGMTVAISGTGGDELFAGYPWFINMAANSHHGIWVEALSTFARLRVFDSLASTRLEHKVYRARTLSSFLSQYALQYQIFGAAGASAILAHDLRKPAHAGRMEFADLQAIDELRGGSTLERVSGLCLRGYTSNQLLRDIDAVSMSHSLEVRVPYLDTVIADLALSLPDEAKLSPSAASAPQNTYRATGAKRILIDAGRALLPKDLDLQAKRGFAMPFDQWLSGSLRDVFEHALADETVEKRGWFNVNETAGLRDSFLAGTIHWPQPWLLMMVELWASQVLDKQG